MFAEGFDGIDFVVLAVPDADPLVGLYADLLGFEVATQSTPEGLGRLLGLPGEASRLVHLQRGAEVGGDVIVAELPGLAVQPPHIPQRRAGVYALDFYLRHAPATEETLASAGWSFVSEAVHYDLPGTTIPVRERMLVQHHSGLLHALVQHRPGGTRSVLGTDAAGRCSEVVAVVILTDNLPAARTFAGDVLGGQEYFTGTFSGAEIERMLCYAPGEGLEAALFRGPRSRNARLEFARPVDGAGDAVPLATVSGESRRRVQVGLRVQDLDALLARLGGADGSGEHGHVAVVDQFEWRGSMRRCARFDTSYDVSLLLLDDEQPLQ